MSVGTIGTLLLATETVMGSLTSPAAMNELEASGSDFFRQISLSAPLVLAQASSRDIAALHRIGVAARLCQQYQLAAMFYSRALELAVAEFGSRSVEATVHRNFLAGVYLAWQKFEICEHYVRESLDFYQRSLGDEHLHTRMTWFALALVLMRQNLSQESKEAYAKCHLREGLHALGADLEVNWAVLTLKVTGLAALKYEQGAYEESLELFRYCLLQEANEAWPGNILVARNLNSLAVLCRFQRHDREGEKFAQMSRDMLQSLTG